MLITRSRLSGYDFGPIMERRLADCKQTWTHDGSDTVHSVSHVRTIVGHILGHDTKILMLSSHGETILVPTRVP